MSQGAEPPSQARLTLLVEDALRVWKEIPTRCLSEAVDEGLILAGNFHCNPGTVAKAWREPSTAKTLQLGGGRQYGAVALAHAKEWDEMWQGLTEEERVKAQEEHRTFFAGLRRRIVGGE